MKSAYTSEDIGVMHYIYLGAPEGGRIDPSYEQAAMDQCSVIFKSFSVTRATGIFRGNREETLIFHIATADTGKVTELAHRLRVRFGQNGVGVIRPTPQGGFYSRVVDYLGPK